MEECGDSSEIDESPVDVARLVDDAAGLLRRFAELDLTALPDTTVADLTRRLIGVQQLATAQATRCARRYDTSMVWALDGSRSATTALSRDTGIAPHGCRRLFDRGRHLEAMPHTAEAFADGSITDDHVDMLIRLQVSERHEFFVRDELELVAMCVNLRHAHVRQAFDYWTARVDAETGNDGTEPALAQRSLRIGKGVGDEYVLEGFLDPVGGAIVTRALDTVVNELAAADRDQPDITPRTPAQLRADALVELCRRGLAVPADAKKARIIVTVVAGDESFARLCELANGDVIRPAALVPYIDAVDVDGVLFDGPTNAVVTSPKRCFTGMLRRVIEVRDRRCQDDSGCDVPLDGCDADHIHAASHGGPTSQRNGRLKCRYHNRIYDNIRRRPRPAATAPVAAGPPGDDRPGTVTPIRPTNHVAGTRPLSNRFRSTG